jgi:hypothetical protein
MKGSIGTSTRLMVIKERKPSKKELKSRAKVKGNHRIKSKHALLDNIAKRKNDREKTKEANFGRLGCSGSNWMGCYSTDRLNE